MRETKAIIESVKRVGNHWQHVELVVDAALEQIQPGQTLLARTEGFWSSYLRELWIPIGFDGDSGTLIVERPVVHNYAPGEAVSIIAPIGSPFVLRKNMRHLLLIALDYPPSRLLFLMLQALRQGVAVTLVLTGNARLYPLGTIPTAVEVVHGDDQYTWPDSAQTFVWADQVFAITHPVFQANYYYLLREMATEARQALPEGFLQGIYDFPLPCGTGACMACMVRGKKDDGLACVDGAAFDLAEVRF